LFILCEVFQDTINYFYINYYLLLSPSPIGKNYHLFNTAYGSVKNIQNWISVSRKIKIPVLIFIYPKNPNIGTLIDIFVLSFSSLVQTRFSRNEAPSGQTGFHTVLNFGHLAI